MTSERPIGPTTSNFTARSGRRARWRCVRFLVEAGPQVEGIDDFPARGRGLPRTTPRWCADVQAVAAAHPQTATCSRSEPPTKGGTLSEPASSDDATDNLSEPGVFFVGQHHAREHLTRRSSCRSSTVRGRGPHPSNEISTLVHTRQIYIVPSLNPDGAEYDIATGSYRFGARPAAELPGHRHGQQPQLQLQMGLLRRVETATRRETYRGPSPLSAPENQRMADFMIAHPNVTTGISYHTYGDLILYPYGYTYEDEPADMNRRPPDVRRDGATMEATAGYHAQQSSDLYITDGDWTDWMYGALPTATRSRSR